jgi:hypothetical protein
MFIEILAMCHVNMVNKQSIKSVNLIKKPNCYHFKIYLLYIGIKQHYTKHNKKKT